ncbi:MAG: hypothetical protein CMJ84_09355 [Planctomycetes bacterium]|jgi:nitroreductase|nr:hypothetical protein [Planctomycetota bacterium]MDP6410843.1 nitroreductase family protein [Planctomycetota bacterium]
MDETGLLELLRAHRTIRRFAGGEVEDGLVARCVKAAQCAATSSHVQAYSLIRVRDRGERERLAELCGGQAQVGEAAAFFVLCADQRRHRLVVERTGAEFGPNFDDFLVAVMDAVLFAQNLALGFEAAGLGVCFIGGLRNRLGEVYRLLELPADVLPLFGLCVGPAAEEPPVRPRLPLAGVFFEGRYPDDAQLLDAIDEHDSVMEREYAAAGKHGRTWSGGIARLFAAARRGDVRAHYRAKGAGLD